MKQPRRKIDENHEKKTRLELIKTIGDRYRGGAWTVKCRILDEFVAVTGYHRYRTRVDDFEAAWPLVMQWLEAEPDRTAQELFQRLQADQPGAWRDGQVRTLQRRVHEWRIAEARRLILAYPDEGRLGATHIAAVGSSIPK